jgi:hypothetical protein
VSEHPDLPTLFLRSEGVALAGLTTFLYGSLEGGWILFLLLLLVPDVCIVGYAWGPRVGAVVYNSFHTYLPPAVLVVVGVAADVRLAVLLGLIWFAHIGMDRTLGYGLKRTTGFRDTHLGRIGGARETRSAEG